MSICGFRARVLQGLRVLFAGALMSGVLPAMAADLPPLPAELTVPSTATRMPAFNLATPSGAAVTASNFKGKIVIARIWASW